MRRVTFTASFVGLAFLLSACVGNLIGEQPAPDALGLDETSVTTSKSVTVGGFTPQQADETFVGDFDATFRDLDWEAIQSEAPVTLPAPKTYTEAIGVESGATVYSATTEALPDTISITGVQLDFTVEDHDGEPSLVFQVGEEGNADITLTKGDCQPATGALGPNCAYEASGDIDSLLLLGIDGGSFTDLWTNVLINQDPADQAAAADQNTIDGSVTLYVETEAGTPNDTQIQMVLDTTNGSIDFAN